MSWGMRTYLVAWNDSHAAAASAQASQVFPDPVAPVITTLRLSVTHVQLESSMTCDLSSFLSGSHLTSATRASGHASWACLSSLARLLVRLPSHSASTICASLSSKDMPSTPGIASWSAYAWAMSESLIPQSLSIVLWFAIVPS